MPTNCCSPRVYTKPKNTCLLHGVTALVIGTVNTFCLLSENGVVENDAVTSVRRQLGFSIGLQLTAVLLQ